MSQIDPQYQYDPDGDESLDDDDTSHVRIPRDNIKAMERDAKSARQAQATADAATRELAFVKAGVDTDSKLGQLLLNSYSGELTVEEIQREATEIGALKAPEVKDDGEGNPNANTPVEDAHTNERQDLSNGALGDNGQIPPADPKKTALDAAEAAMKAGAPREDAMGAMFGSLVGAAAAGDERVIIKPQRG